MRKIKLELNKDDFKKKLGIENGKDGHTPTKKELTDLIKPLIPEPKKEVIIEKTEVVREQPIIKEVAKYETADEIADKINTLDGQIDFKVLTNVPKKTTGVINRYFSSGVSGIKEVIAGNGISVDNSSINYPIVSTSFDINNYVPYIGATTGVNLGNNNLIIGKEFFNTDVTNKQLMLGLTSDSAGFATDPLVITGDINDFFAFSIQNKSAGDSAYTDVIVRADNDGLVLDGHYVDTWISSSGFNAETSGTVKGISIRSGGTGYVIDDECTILSGDNNCILKVLTVDGSGAVLTFEMIANGTGYVASKTYRSTSTTGIGTGFEVYINSTYDNSLVSPNDGGIYTSGGNILIGTTTCEMEGDIIFHTNGFATENEVARITKDGLGIGTTTPTYPLTIVANTNVNPLSISGNFNQAGTIRAQSTLNTGYSGMNMYDESGTLSASFAYGNTSASSFTNEFVFASRKSTTALKFYQGGVSAGAERIRIDASANIALLNAKVGIGTTSPVTGSLLDVYGSARVGKSINAIGKTLTIAGNITHDRVTNPTNAQITGITVTNGGAGSIPAGTYYYCVMFSTAEGDTGVTGLTYSTFPTITSATPFRTTLSNIPVSTDPRVTSRKVYRSQAGTVGDYYYLYLIGTIADNTTTTFSDNTTAYNSTDWIYNKNNTTAGLQYIGNSVYTRLGDYVTAFGNNAFGSLTRGSTCAAFGSSALVNCTTGDSNQAFGHSALSSITTGSSNVAMGYASGQGNQTGSGNVSIGQDCLRNNSLQSYTGNTAVGTQALGILANSNNYNSALGYASGYNAQGSYGVYIGYFAGRQNIATSVGSGNIVIGYNAGTALGTGNYNVLIGYDVELGSPNTSSQLNIGNIIYGTGMGTGSTASATGKVGIGTESLSTSKLTVADNFTVKGIASSGTNIDLLTASAEPKIVAKVSNTDEWSLGINSVIGSDAVSLFANSKKIILAGNGTTLDIETGGGETAVHMGESENAFLVWSVADSDSFIKVDTVNYKTTFNLGDVGIGTESPTAKLDVNKDIIRLRTSKTPASASDAGNQGDICWDSSYIYVCTSTDTWKRAGLATW